MAALAGVQPVHGPHPRVVAFGVPGGVVVQRAEPGRHRVHRRIHLVHPPGQRPGQRAGQAEHPARVGQPHGQHLGARGAQRAHRMRGRRSDLGHVEAGPQRVVDPDDDAGDVRGQPQRRGQLVPLDVRDPRPARREDMQARLAHTLGEQRGPAPPGPAAGEAYRIADTQRDRVAQGRELGHALPPARLPGAFRRRLPSSLVPRSSVQASPGPEPTITSRTPGSVATSLSRSTRFSGASRPT